MVLDIIQITKSKTRIAILELFFNDSEQEYYLRQIEKLTGYSVGNIRREINNLQAGGLFAYRMLGRVKLYRLNKDYAIYNELKNIIRKTISIEGALRKIMQPQTGIRFSFIYGSFAKGREVSLSDIDIIIIGDINPRIVKSKLFEYQSEVKREINSTVYTEEEFIRKVKEKNHFISAIIKEPKIFLRGSEDEFRRFIQVQ